MQPETAYSQLDEFDALLALLRTIGDEVYCLACDIISLGETFSSDLGPDAPSRQLHDIQSFDPIGQRALAQARLVHGLERVLAGRAVDWKERVDALIQSVPFHADRQRLSAALRGQEMVEHGRDSSRNDNNLDLF